MKWVKGFSFLIELLESKIRNNDFCKEESIANIFGMSYTGPLAENGVLQLGCLV